MDISDRNGDASHGNVIKTSSTDFCDVNDAELMQQVAEGDAFFCYPLEKRRRIAMVSEGLRKKRRKRKTGKICGEVVRILLVSVLMTGLLTFVRQKKELAVPAEECGMYLSEKKEIADHPAADENGNVPGLTQNQGTETVTSDKKETVSKEVCEACRKIYEKNPKLCVLVNKEVELDPSFDSHLRSICRGRLEVSDWMYQDLTDMLHAAGEAGYDYWIASAYRSRARQQELVDEDVAALMRQGKNRREALEETLKETMPAGHSEHETGLALDILCSGNADMDASQAEEPANRWLLSHCSEYGFILRYPRDKVSVTGIAWEPWHFRYVGKEAAKYMAEQGLTLEEFCGAAARG